MRQPTDAEAAPALELIKRAGAALKALREAQRAGQQAAEAAQGGVAYLRVLCEVEDGADVSLDESTGRWVGKDAPEEAE